MKRLINAGTTAAILIGAGTGLAQAQSSGTSSSAPSSSSSSSSASSPFSGLFGGKKGNDSSPIDLNFTVEGDDGTLAKLIRNSSLLANAQDEGRVTGQDLLAAARGDYARILGTLYDDGYYAVVINITLDGVEAAQVAPLDAPRVVRKVEVHVQPGPRYHYSRAEIAPVAPGSEIPSDYKKGEVARTGDIKRAANAGVTGWRDVGYAKARVANSEIVADSNNNTIDSQISLDPGPQLRFGKLTIRGEERMEPRRLRKIAGFPEGQRFDPEKVEDVRKRLRRSGVFSAITLSESDYVNPDNTLDMDLLVIEQKPRRIGGGFEYSNSDGLAVTGYWMHRNLLRGGERLRFDVGVSDIGSGTSGQDMTVGVRLDRPATLNPDTTGYVLATAERLREEDYDQDSATVGLGFTYIPNDRLTADVGLQYRALNVTDDNGDTRFRLLALPVSVTWDRRDEPTDAKRGFWVYGSVLPFYGLEESTGDGAQIIAEGRGYYSFGEDDKFTLAGRARIGTVVGPDIDEVPRDYLFYSGGGGTVRGQPFESLGVREIPGPDGAVKTGGMSIVTLTAEARIAVREKIGIAVFADAGRVWSEGGWQGDNDWQGGAGAGIRYKTPIGPLRFDVAGPVGGDTGRGMQVYLGLGQAF